MRYEFLMMAAATMTIGLVVSLVLLGACYFAERDHHHGKHGKAKENAPVSPA